MQPRSWIGGGLCALTLALAMGMGGTGGDARPQRGASELDGGVIMSGSGAIQRVSEGETAPSSARVHPSPSTTRAARGLRNGLRGGGAAALFTAPIFASRGTAQGATAAATDRSIDWRQLLRTRLHYRGTRAEPGDARA